MGRHLPEWLGILKITLPQIGVVLALVLGGYWWLEDRVAERRSELVSDAVVDRITERIAVPWLDRYLADRTADSLRWHRAESLALQYMTRMDSMVQSQDIRIPPPVIHIPPDTSTSMEREMAALRAQLAAMHAQDSTARVLLELTRAIEAANRRKIENLKSGDRAE